MHLTMYENSYMLIFPCNLMICSLSKLVIIFQLEWTKPLIKIDPKKSLSNAIFVIELSSASSILDEPILKPAVATTPISTSVITTTVTPTTEKSKMLFQKSHAHCQIPCPSILFQTILDLAGTIWMGPNCFGLIKTFWT